jgi:hypothetical protein
MKSHSNVERIKSIIITILIAIIFLLVVKNSVDRSADRMIQKIEFQKLLDELQPSVRTRPPKIEI